MMAMVDDPEWVKDMILTDAEVCVAAAEKMIDDYTTPVALIEDGEPCTLEPLTGREPIDFPEPYGTLECFYSAGGLPTLARAIAAAKQDPQHQTEIKTLDFRVDWGAGHTLIGTDGDGQHFAQLYAGAVTVLEAE